MAKPVECRIVGMPDGRFAVIAVLASGKVFRHAGLTSFAEAEESVGMLRDLMAACGARVTVEVSPLCEAPCRVPADSRDRGRVH